MWKLHEKRFPRINRIDRAHEQRLVIIHSLLSLTFSFSRSQRFFHSWPFNFQYYEKLTVTFVPCKCNKLTSVQTEWNHLIDLDGAERKVNLR